MPATIVFHEPGVDIALMERRAIAYAAKNGVVVRNWTGKDPLPETAVVAFLAKDTPLPPGAEAHEVVGAATFAGNMAEVEQHFAAIAAQYDLSSVQGAVDGHFEDLIGFGLACYMLGVSAREGA